MAAKTFGDIITNGDTISSIDDNTSIACWQSDGGSGHRNKMLTSAATFLTDYINAKIAAYALPYSFLENTFEITSGSDADHDLSISAGKVVDSTGSKYLESDSVIVKQSDAAWAAGTNAGGDFTGSGLSSSTDYHFFAIEKDSDGSIDFGWDTSIIAANIPTGYTKYRRLLSIKTSASSTLNFGKKIGNRIIVDVPKEIISTSSAVSNTRASLDSLVPAGIDAIAIISTLLVDPADREAWVWPTSEICATDRAPTQTYCNIQVRSSSTTSVSQIQVAVDSSADISYRFDITTGPVRFALWTEAYIDMAFERGV